MTPVTTMPKGTTPPSEEVPRLENGDRLTRAEFERRYEAMPELKKAELIEGVVYVPSPVRFTQHAGPHFDLITWMGHYRAFTPGVQGADNATVRLDMEPAAQARDTAKNALARAAGSQFLNRGAHDRLRSRLAARTILMYSD